LKKEIPFTTNTIFEEYYTWCLINRTIETEMVAKALAYIKSDTFSIKGWTSKTAFKQIWILVINTPEVEIRNSILSALTNNLVDAINTCSRGYITRIASAPTGIIEAIGVGADIAEEITATLKHLIASEIENISDEELKFEIMDGLLDDCEDWQQKESTNIILKVCKSQYSVIKSTYPDLSSTDFKRIWQSVKKELI